MEGEGDKQNQVSFRKTQGKTQGQSKVMIPDVKPYPISRFQLCTILQHVGGPTEKIPPTRAACRFHPHQALRTLCGTQRQDQARHCSPIA